MSGICGLRMARIQTQGPSRTVQDGLDAMAHRGPDGFSIYPHGGIVLGHALLDTGCNGLFVDEAGYAISFDGRIDNRGELASALCGDSVEPTDVERLHDKNLLLLAYRRFGRALPGMLRGDFAIAIADPDREELFLCRDHFGVRPLFYRWVGEDFHFASEIGGLRAMGGKARFSPREQAIARFVKGELDDTAPERTFYEEVLRLPGGHHAVVCARGISVARYWSLDPGLPVARNDAPEQFRALFAQAIERRLRTTKPLGALLSGGLDSSAIVSMIGARATRANPAAISVFSLTFPGDSVADESPYIDAVADAFGLEVTRIEGNAVTAFQDMDLILAEQSHLPQGPNIATSRYILQEVASRGDIGVVLDGHGGDEVVSYGTGLFFELAETGRWLKLWRTLGESEEVLGPRAGHFRRLLAKRGLRAWRSALGRRLRRKRAGARDPVRVAADGRARPAEQALQLSKLLAPLYPHALEVMDHHAAAAGIEMRMPFMDVDLVSFCVTVPAEAKWHAGYPRAILRKALAGILPPLVAERRTKYDFSDRLRTSMLRDHADLVDEALFARGGWISPYADLGDLRKWWRTLKETGMLGNIELAEIWRAVSLSCWLRMEGAGETASGKRLLQAAE